MRTVRLAGITPRLVALGMVGAILTGCKFLGFETWHWRQKLVLEVETPRGTVTGGSVVQIDINSGPSWLPDTARINQSVRGEASFVEVAPGRYLFALLSGGTEAGGARELFASDAGKGTFSEANDKVVQAAGRKEILEDIYTRFVTFVDISDPKSVRRVDPSDLAATFGRGYRLKAMTLEITREPVTRGEIEKILSWMDEYENRQLDGERYQNARSSLFASSLNLLDFVSD